MLSPSFSLILQIKIMGKITNDILSQKNYTLCDNLDKADLDLILFFHKIQFCDLSTVEINQ
jgi:hypothetical protein